MPANAMRWRRRRYLIRRGTTAVEAAFVFPALFLLLFAIIEFGHAQMVSDLLKAASRTGARYGATEGVTTAQVITKVQEVLATAIDPQQVTVLVKDASVFDDGGAIPTEQTNYAGLDEIQLQDAEPRQLYVVRVSVPYGAVGLLPVGVYRWLSDLTLTGQTVMRHE